MTRKKTTHIKAKDVERARYMRKRLARRRYKARIKLGIRLNKPRVSNEELDRRVLQWEMERSSNCYTSNQGYA